MQSEEIYSGEIILFNSESLKYKKEDFYQIKQKSNIKREYLLWGNLFARAGNK